MGFRFIDTAGIRETQDVVESIGIKKTFEKIGQAQVVVYLVDSSRIENDEERLKQVLIEIEKIKNKFPQKPIVIIANKTDRLTSEELDHLKAHLGFISNTSFQPLSAKTGTGVEELKERLLEFVNTGALRNSDTIVTNSRHYAALLKALEEINKVEDGLNADLSGDLLAIDIRQALHHFGEITGEITNDDLLGNIFANFCIGK